MTSGQTKEREYSHKYKQKNGLKMNWTWPHPPEQDLVYSTASPSHQEASTRLISSSIRGQFSSVQFNFSVMSNSLQFHGLEYARLPCPSPTPGVYSNSSIESVMPSNHLIRCRPLLLLPSIFPSIRVFPNESVLLIRWPKYWSFSFSISPSSEYSGLISFRTDWLDLLAVQGTLKSLSNTTIHKHQFFNAQLILKCSHILGFAYEHDNIF